MKTLTSVAAMTAPLAGPSANLRRPAPMSDAAGSMDSVVAALYRRYRPESFAEMIGQSQVTDPLMTALRTGRIGHAYLFSGPRGCGKTTSARILARCLNCAEGPTDTPCGTCPSCVELSRSGGGSLDVVEIDAASHGGVDDARDLRERAVFAPARDRFKIFIIDEAHMVTAGGFNALLKIVEEPPPHVKFVFATTEPDKVIGTIRSRTHHYPFRLIAPGTLIDYVQSLCDSEGVNVEPGVLPLVVRAGGGSVRDTLSILDQLIAGSEGDTVTAERAAGLLGFTHTELIDDVVTALGAHDAAAAFRAIDRVIQTGQDPRRFAEDLLERLRDLIVVSATTVDGAAAVFRGVPQDQLDRMFEQSQVFGRGELSRIADTVSAGLDGMTGATAPKLQLELMIARALLQAGAEFGVPSPPNAAQATPARPVPTQSVPTQPSASRAPAPQPPGPQSPALQSRPAPDASETHVGAGRPDAVAALAAARGAARSEPHAGANPVASNPSTTSAHAAGASSPNAAETAASIREFLRDDGAGASGGAPTTPQETGKPTDGDHPNTGAAAFGRPISDVLSRDQIANMGRDGAFNASQSESQATATPAAPPAPQPQSAAEREITPAEPSGASAERAAAPEEPEASPSGLEDLIELWPELLEEILHNDREAWNAVRLVQPVALDGDVLSIGVESKSDLDVFKAAGAGPLRETIHAATGLTVRYVPKRIAPNGAGSQNAPQREPSDGQRTPQREPDAEEPHRSSPSESRASTEAAAPGAPADDPMRRADERLSAFGLGPALAAPAWADPVPETPDEQTPEPMVETAPVDTAQADTAQADTEPAETAPAVNEVPSASNDPYAGTEPDAGEASYAGDDPYAGGDPYVGEDDAYGGGDPYSADESPVPTGAVAENASKILPENVPEVPARSAPEVPARSAPALTRYGEAVVREVLGARFVEECPLPPSRAEQ